MRKRASLAAKSSATNRSGHEQLEASESSAGVESGSGAESEASSLMEQHVDAVNDKIVDCVPETVDQEDEAAVGELEAGRSHLLSLSGTC